MKTLCVSILLLTTPGFTSDHTKNPSQNHEISFEGISEQVREFFYEIGFPVYGKSDEEIKQEYPIWISKKENQDRFLTKLSSQIQGEHAALSADEVEALESLKEAFKLWTNVIESKEKPLVVSSHFFHSMNHLTLSCSRGNCHNCRECNSLDEEIQEMRDEIADLKSDAQDRLIRSGIEAVGARASAAGKQLLPAAGGVYCASKDLIDGCRTYNEAVELERRVDDLERFRHEGDRVEKDKSDNQWWQFWK